MSAVRFPKPEVVLSQPLIENWDISSKFGMPEDFHLPKRVPSPKLNPEVDFRLYGRHLEKSIWRHNFAADNPITTIFDSLMQNDLPMTINRSKSKPSTIPNMAAVRFTKPEVVISQPWMRYLIEIWYASRFPSSPTNAITKTEPGSRFPTLWPPSCKIDMAS